MKRKQWMLAAAILALVGVSGCASVSQKWQQFRGKEVKPIEQLDSVSRQLYPTFETGRWVGLYQLRDGAGAFRECATGQTVPVLVGGDSALLENAFMASGTGVSAPMLASFEGRMVQRPSVDIVLAKQGVNELAVHVERFVSLSSAVHCPADKAAFEVKSNIGTLPVAPNAPAQETFDSSSFGQSQAPMPNSKSGAHAHLLKDKANLPLQPTVEPTSASLPLQDTYWKFVELHSHKIDTPERDLHVILQSPAKLAGFAGCNHFLGDWLQVDSDLQFAKIATTRKSCAPKLMRLEREILEVLPATRSWHIDGRVLRLLNTHGEVLATLHGESSQ